MLRILGNKERLEHTDKYRPMLARHFNNPDFAYDPKDFDTLRASPFMIASAGMEEEKEVKSFGSMVVVTAESAKELFAGTIKEHEVQPYPPGGNDTGFLFWLTLVIENKKHAPYLIRSLCKQLETKLREWKINIDTVFAIAYTKISERLLRRYKFQKVGDYQGKYPIMAAKVTENVYLKAVIPNINTTTNAPWK